MTLVQVNDTCKTMGNSVDHFLQRTARQHLIQMGFCDQALSRFIQLCKDFLQFLHIFRLKKHVQGQARDMKAFSSLLSLNPLQLQDHYSTTEYSEPIRLLDQVAPLQHEQCCFVPFRSVVTYSCMCHSIPGSGNVVHVPSSANVQ